MEGTHGELVLQVMTSCLHNSIVTKTVKISSFVFHRRKSYRFEMTWTWIQRFHFWVTIALRVCLLYWSQCAWPGLASVSGAGATEEDKEGQGSTQQPLKVKVTWPSMVTHTLNLCSAFNPSKCTHTAVNTHTHREHTRGAVWGSVSCSRAPQSWYWRWKRALYIHSLHLQFLPDLRLELATFGFPNHDFPVRTYMIATS